MKTPKTMKQVQARKFGGPEVLEVVTTNTPAPGPGEVLIRVEAAAVNFSDVMRRRASPYPFPTTLPYVPGSEVAGTVEAVGKGVTAPAVGARVFAVVGADGSGGYAEFALAQAAQAIPIPDGLSADVACGLLVAGSTAVLLLTEAAKLQRGESIFVPAAAGGVGSLLVQLARHLGAGRVIAAASSAPKRDAVKALGADVVLDATNVTAAAVREATGGQGVDVWLEMEGGASLEQGVQALAPFGRAVVYGSASTAPRTLSQAAQDFLWASPSLGQSVIAFNLGLFFGLKPQAAGAAVGRLLEAIGSGAVTLRVGEVFPLARAADAHRALEGRRTMGKLVLRPGGAS
ncbi:MAG: zinc-binding dehydrogenase [Myxococcaceae bacterium]|jgi:NADPH:quinone reductase-like Zn-dependent oxidoreductase|nr:zinc-binding dehydrogenase [Myxococcaceae bacterium]